MATAQGVLKLSTRDLPVAVARRADGATTVAATMWLADASGLSVFATGGIGGVHRGEAHDVSADLTELGRTGHGGGVRRCQGRSWTCPPRARRWRRPGCWWRGGARTSCRRSTRRGAGCRWTCAWTRRRRRRRCGARSRRWARPARSSCACRRPPAHALDADEVDAAIRRALALAGGAGGAGQGGHAVPAPRRRRGDRRALAGGERGPAAQQRARGGGGGEGDRDGGR